MWNPLRETALAIFSFHGREILPNYGIDLDLGDTVLITEQCGPWFRGYTKSRRESRGVFPASYVKLRSSRRGGQRDPVIERTEDPVAKEIVVVIREWGEILKKLYVTGGAGTDTFEKLRGNIREMATGRLQIITGSLTLDQLREVKLTLAGRIDKYNRHLGLDLVPRIGYEVVDPVDVGAVKLYHVHNRPAENTEAGKETIRRKSKTVSTSQTAVVGHHLSCSVRGFSYQLSDCEVYFSLYDATRAQFITERFLVKFCQNGLSSFVDKLQTQGTTVFEDLGNMDIKSDLYLVAQVIRIGKMFYSDSTKKSNQSYKRPCMVGVLSIKDFLDPPPPKAVDTENDEKEEIKIPEVFVDPDEEKEFTFKLYSGEEKDFFQLHDLLIRKQGKVSVVSGAGQYGLIVGLKVFTGDLSTVKQEDPILLKTAVNTKKLGFPDVIYPGDVRNDLYITLDRAELEKGGKLLNVEVSLLVLDSEGNILPNSVFGASSGMSGQEYKSVILYHQNSPRWNETIRLTLPIEQFANSHFRIEYRHCSTKDKNEKKLFGFSFAKLMDEEGTTLKDGSHDLFIYKCEDRAKLRNVRSYLGLPFSSISVPSGGRVIGNQAFQRSLKESLNISSLLVSTKLTQNMDLVNLLKWKSHPEKIKQTLENMAHVSGEEIVKFLQDVLDALFSMFLSEIGESCEYSGDVFIVLVNICVLLEDSKFEHFKPVIDTYITDHFAAALVYKGLLSTVQHYADVCIRASKEFHGQIQKCFKSLEFIFKFIVQSHILFARATCGEVRDSFTKNVNSLFVSLNKMLEDANDLKDIGIGSMQSALLFNLSKIYTELIRVMPALELTRMVCGLFTNIPLKESAHALSPAKLTALHHLVKSPLFSEKESRGIILPEVCRHLKHHLSCREELKLCTDVLDDILIFLYSHSQQMDNRIHDDIECLSTNTLEMLVQCVLVLERTSLIVGNLVTCLIGILQLMDEFHYNRLWDEFRERKPLRDVLLRVFLVFRDLIKHDVFPVDWVVMKLLTDSIMLKSMHQFSQPLTLHFLNKHSFDTQLWSQYFNLAVTFLAQPSLQLEKFHGTKRDHILQRYGDMRVQMGFQILSMWQNLGEQKINFIPSLVGPFLEVTLIPEFELRRATLNIFYDMLEAEHKYHGDFKQVECELIDKLDVLVSQNKGDDEYRQLFSSILLERVTSLNPSWESNGTAFINSVTRLMERLLDYRNVLQGDENRDKRMLCTVNLLNFYNTEINRSEMYLRYIYKLHDLHFSAQNYAEAGFTLLLHTEMLGWGMENLPPDIHYQMQTESERKEAIYLKVIEYFDQGKLWEKALPLCKELAILYEFKLYNYGKLSQILGRSAAFFENILTQLRPEHEYFRVGFFGSGFPLFVRNKEFIYRGLEYERLATFIQRILTEWPTATMLKNIPPDDSIINSDGQFIQICNVRPMPDMANPIISKAEVPEKIQAYYLANNVDTFLFDRRLHKLVVEDPDNEFKNMWIERTKMRTSSPLPGILPWFEVVEKKIEELAPVRYACEKIEDVNRQLNSLINQYSSDAKKSVNPLSMRLQGVLDANVMGGLPKYRDAFFTQDFIQNNPNSASHVAKLKSLILDQVIILDHGLSLHGRIAPQGVQPLHKRLLECFAQMRTTVETDFSYSPSTPLRRSESLRDSQSFRQNSSRIVNTPLPPVPSGVKRLTTESSVSNRSSSSSGYGHLVHTFEPNSSDEDEVYSKPTDSKKYTEMSTPPSSIINSFTSINSPPPIPNRLSKRGPPLSKYTSHSKSSEYILMPPNRVRELHAERNKIGSNGSLNNSILDDSAISTLLNSLNESFHTVDGSPVPTAVTNGRNGNANSIEDVTDGAHPIPVPPLPPRTSTVSCERSSVDMDSPVPLLPKRQPKKVPLTPMSSTDSDKVSVSSAPSSPVKGAPPPVPPKPRSNSSIPTESESNYLNKYELMNVPGSPSYEDRFENNTILSNSKPTIEASINDNPPGDGDNNTIQISQTPPRQIPAPTVKRGGSHREFYTLPFKNSPNSAAKD